MHLKFNDFIYIQVTKDVFLAFVHFNFIVKIITFYLHFLIYAYQIFPKNTPAVNCNNTYVFVKILYPYEDPYLIFT